MIRRQQVLTSIVGRLLAILDFCKEKTEGSKGSISHYLNDKTWNAYPGYIVNVWYSREQARLGYLKRCWDEECILEGLPIGWQKKPLQSKESMEVEKAYREFKDTLREKILEQSFHAYYEVKMLRAIAGIFAGEHLQAPKEWDPQFSENVLVESFATHVRTLEDFFWNPKYYKSDDCFAEMFFSSPEEWKRICPGKPSGIPRERVNKEIAHLTFNREIDRSKKEWQPVSIYRLLQPTIQVFAESHMPRHLDWETLTPRLPLPALQLVGVNSANPGNPPASGDFSFPFPCQGTGASGPNFSF